MRRRPSGRGPGEHLRADRMCAARSATARLATVRGLAVGGLMAVLLLVGAARAAELFVVEDWSGYAVGTQGVPGPWQRQSWGSPAYDFAVSQDEGRRVLRLQSRGDSSTIIRDIRGKVSLKDTPLIEWSWKVIALPQGADSRRKETDDQAAQIYVTWPRFPEAVRSRIIGYVWDTTAPVGTVVKSQKTGTITYVVVRSGSGELGRWLTERRNLRDDFRQIYGEEPEAPAAVSIAIDSDDVKGSAESLFGSIAFRRP